MRLIGRRIPKNIGLIPEGFATRNNHTTIVVDSPMLAAPWLGNSFTIAQYAQAVDFCASRLTSLGVGGRARVAIVRENHLEVQLLAAATARIGAVPAALSAANTEQELVDLLASLQSDALLMSSAVAERFARSGVDASSLASNVVQLDGEARPGAISWHTLSSDRPAVVAPVADDQVMLITHTSGTTNLPKLVMHTANSLWAGTRVELLPVPGGVSRPSDRFLTAIPFVHSRAFTWVTAQFYWGPDEMIAVGDYGQDTVERLLRSEGPTIIESLPNVLQHWKPLVESHPELFEQVRLYINTFDAIHASIARPYVLASSHRNVMWAHSWGQSEVGPMAAGIFTKGSFRRATKAGKELQMSHLGLPWLGLVRMRVVDPDTGRRVPRGVPGLLQVRSDSIAVGYQNSDEHYRRKWSGSWWNTGDFGYQDRLGRVKFLGRSVDRLQSDSALELETALLDRLPECEEVVVIPNGSSAPVPVLCLRSGGELSDGRWREVVDGLPPLSPPVVVPMAEVPRTTTWKIKRAGLRERVARSVELQPTEADRRFI